MRGPPCREGYQRRMRYVSGMQGVGSSFSLPFKAPDWFGTFAVVGLIAFIPIAGILNLLGWTLTLLDHYRAGRTDLPPANFGYMRRGLNAGVVFLIYTVVLDAFLFVPFFLFIFSSISSGDSSGAVSAVFGGTFLLLFAFFSMVSLLLYLAYIPIIIATEHGGIQGGLNLRLVFRMMSHSWGNTLIAAVLTYAAFFISGIGVYACCIGYIISLPYGFAVLAGVTRHFEHTLGPPGLVPPGY